MKKHLLILAALLFILFTFSSCMGGEESSNSNGSSESTSSSESTEESESTSTSEGTHVCVFDEWTTVTAPTCEAAGTRERACACGETETETVSATGHSFTSYASNDDVTCTTDGTKTATCDNGCGKTDTVADTGTATGHTAGAWITDTAATCTVDGVKHQDCTVCGETAATEAIPATGHADSTWIVLTAATCLAEGVQYLQCDTCDNILKLEAIPATGHTGGAWIVDIASTCTAVGKQHQVCAVCEKTVNEEEIAVIPHSFTSYRSNDNATCEADGTKTAACDNGCGATDTAVDEGSAKGHTGGAWIVDNAPTCTEKGTKHQVCAECGITLANDTVAATGHSFTRYLTNNDATCQADGTETATCDNGCGDKDTRNDAGSKKSHLYIRYSSNNDATCTANGTKTAYCYYGCGKKQTVTDVGSAKGHADSNNDYRCDNCGFSIPRSIHTVTFKNFMGNTITTVEVYDGDLIPADLIPSVLGYTVYTANQYDELEVKDGIIAYPNLDGYYVASADVSKINSTVAVPYGMVFKGWVSDHNGVTIGTRITADVTFTVVFEGVDGIIPRTVPITIDGLRDASYVYMGSMLKHPIASKVPGVLSGASGPALYLSDKLNKYVNKEDIDLDESLTDEEKEAVKAEWQQEYDNYHKSGDLDGRLYMAWDGDYIYFYVEVDDSIVVTEGKEYCSIDNPYENDGVEVFYGINNRFSKLCLDAMGFHLYSGENPSKYLDWLGTNNMYATTIRDGEGNIMTDIDFDDGTPRVLVEGAKAGYAVEYALPAYAEPTAVINAENPLGATPGSQNWGTKLSAGDVVYFSLQVDCVSAVADENSLQQSVAGNASKLNSLSTNKAELKRWNAGWQMRSYNSTNPAGALQLILG